MKKNLFIWQVVGATFTAVLGTVLHFLYQWTSLTAVAPVSAVNESTWEHMKLIFIPSLIFAFVQSFWAKKLDCFWFFKAIGILIGTLLIPVLFYTLSGAFGKLSAVVNIAVFFVAVFSEYLIELYLFKRVKCKLKLKWISVGLLLVILALFFIFTFYPPQIPLFADPRGYGYGII